MVRFQNDPIGTQGVFASDSYKHGYYNTCRGGEPQGNELPAGKRVVQGLRLLQAGRCKLRRQSMQSSFVLNRTRNVMNRMPTLRDRTLTSIVYLEIGASSSVPLILSVSKQARLKQDCTIQYLIGLDWR